MTQQTFSDRAAVINELTSKLLVTGRINNQQKFIDAVMKREDEAPTALGESLAVPHGKSDAVIRASFACAILPEPMLWPGLEGNESVQLVFLLAIPEQEAGSTHIQLLAKLTNALLEDEFRTRLLAAKDHYAVIQLFESLEQQNISDCSKGDQTMEAVSVELQNFTYQKPSQSSASQSVESQQLELIETNTSSTPYFAVLFSGIAISMCLFFLL